MTEKWYDKAKNVKTEKGKTSRGIYTKGTYRQMIRRMCMHCCGNMATEVKECPAQDCPLWPARMGGTLPETPDSLPERKLDCV